MQQEGWAYLSGRKTFLTWRFFYTMENSTDSVINSGGCINCGQAVSTPFCSQCGQPFPPQRMSLGQMFADFQGRVYGTNGLFQRTVRELTLHPGKVSASYVAGNRVLYMRPIGYFFLTITVMLLLANALGIKYAEFLKVFSPQAPASNAGQKKINEMNLNFIADNLRLLSFIIVPIQAFVSRYLFFRKSGYSYLEHTVLPFYLAGHINWLLIFAILLLKLFHFVIPYWLMIGLTVIYYGNGYVGWIHHQSKLKAFAKGIGTYLVTQLFFGLLAIIVFIIYAILNPEFLETIKN